MQDGLTVGEIARRLADDAEAFCRAWLPGGRKVGDYWQCGDVKGEAGRSLAVRLRGPRVGKWTDYATDAHGDLIDLIERQRGCSKADAVRGAREWLNLPRTDSTVVRRPAGGADARARSEGGSNLDREERARRLFARGGPIEATPAEAYLRARGITAGGPALRYLATTYYRDGDAPACMLPALLCAITEDDGTIVGVNRIYVTEGGERAEVENPKKVLGRIAPCAVRFGQPAEAAGRTLVVGEGVETMLSIRTALPELSVAAALTARHLRMFEPPNDLELLWIARDAGRPGETAAEDLMARLTWERPGLDIRLLKPRGGDFNDRLRQMGARRFGERFARGDGADAVGRGE